MESRQGETTFLYGTTFAKELSTFEDIVLNGELTMDSIKKTVKLKLDDKIIVDGEEILVRDLLPLEE